MMMRSMIVAAMAGLVALAIAGCATSLTGDTVSREDARAQQRVDFGHIEAVRNVVIECSNTMVGTATGAILGGLAGSTIGGGRGQAAATVAGAVAGGVAGTRVEEAATRAQGVELTVRLDDGRVVAVVQEASPNDVFLVGDRVRLMTVRGTTRVAR
jgi:outer membrane lipoprotein SlyB